MAAVVGAYEAKTNLAALLERVERGEQIIITKHGRPIARLLPMATTDLDRRAVAVERIKALRKGITLGMPLKEVIEEGRL